MARGQILARGADNRAAAYAPWIGLDASKLQEKVRGGLAACKTLASVRGPCDVTSLSLETLLN